MSCFSSTTFAHSSLLTFPVSPHSPSGGEGERSFRSFQLIEKYLSPSSSHSFFPSRSFYKSLLLRGHRCSAIEVGRTRNTKPFQSISFFQEEGGSNTQQQQKRPKRRNPGRNGAFGSYKKRTQEELLKRIAQEVRQRREGDRESTPVVRALTWACRRANLASDVDAVVAGLDLPLPIFTSAVQKLGFEGRPQAAVAVFQWLQMAPGKHPNVYTYNSLLGALKTNGWFETAQDVFEQMEVSVVVPDVVTFNTLISLHEQQGQLDHALKIFNSLRSLGVQPTLFTFRNVIQILGKKRDVETALDVFRDFKQQQLDGTDLKESQVVELKRDSEQRQQLEKIMTQLCCERLMQLISKDRKKGDEALKFLMRLRRSKVRLHGQAYEQLIQACGGEAEEDHKVVRVLYGDMRDQQVQMSASLCNHVIQVLGRCKKWWAGLEVYDHMVQHGPEPNAFTRKLLLSHFQVLLNAASKRRIWKWSLQLLDKMIEKGLEPDEFSWNAALISCAKAGQQAAAVLVFKKMTERGHRPGIISYGALLSALEKSDCLPAAELVWEHMRKVGLKPNIVAYTTMISLYGKAGKFGEAMHVVDNMRETGTELSVVTFNALITACARAGDGERALDLVEQMKAAWIQPDAVTYAQLIEALANEGRWEPATAVYAKMQELKLKPPSYTYDAVVRVCKANNVAIDLQPATGAPEP